MILILPFLVVVVIIFLYLHLTPIQASTNQPVEVLRMHIVIDSMQVMIPEGDDRIESIKADVTLIAKITQGIKNDKIACIIPTKDEIQSIKNQTKIVFPDSAAFGGDAIVGSKNIIKQKNPLLEIVKEKEKNIHKLIDAIQLDLDVKGDKFKTRFMKKSMILKKEVDDMKHKVVSGCSRQKIRLRSSHPHLSNYEFIDENVSNGALSPSSYVHGKSVTPVERDYQIENSHLGLVREFFSY